MMLPLPPGPFQCLVADVPWQFATRSPKGLEGRPQHYDRMTLADIKAMPVADVAAPDCWLFFWSTGPHLQQAFKVINAWGFTYSGMGFTWIKMNKRSRMVKTQTKNWFAMEDVFMGGGYTTRKCAEFALLARRGEPKRLAADVHEVIISRRQEHSRKPAEALQRIERFCDGPRLELFSRTDRPGWTSYGAEAGKFNEDDEDD